MPDFGNAFLSPAMTMQQMGQMQQQKALMQQSQQLNALNLKELNLHAADMQAFRDYTSAPEFKNLPLAEQLQKAASFAIGRGDSVQAAKFMDAANLNAQRQAHTAEQQALAEKYKEDVTIRRVSDIHQLASMSRALYGDSPQGYQAFIRDLQNHPEYNAYTKSLANVPFRPGILQDISDALLTQKDKSATALNKARIAEVNAQTNLANTRATLAKRREAFQETKGGSTKEPQLKEASDSQVIQAEDAAKTLWPEFNDMPDQKSKIAASERVANYAQALVHYGYSKDFNGALETAIQAVSNDASIVFNERDYTKLPNHAVYYDPNRQQLGYKNGPPTRGK